jgi:hypothetical protein
MKKNRLFLLILACLISKVEFASEYISEVNSESTNVNNSESVVRMEGELTPEILAYIQEQAANLDAAIVQMGTEASQSQTLEYQAETFLNSLGIEQLPVGYETFLEYYQSETVQDAFKISSEDFTKTTDNDFFNDEQPMAMDPVVTIDDFFNDEQPMAMDQIATIDDQIATIDDPLANIDDFSDLEGDNALEDEDLEDTDLLEPITEIDPVSESITSDVQTPLDTLVTLDNNDQSELTEKIESDPLENLIPDIDANLKAYLDVEITTMSAWDAFKEWIIDLFTNITNANASWKLFSDILFAAGNSFAEIYPELVSTDENSTVETEGYTYDPETFITNEQINQAIYDLNTLGANLSENYTQEDISQAIRDADISSMSGMQLITEAAVTLQEALRQA